MSAPVLHPGIKTSSGPVPAFPASITRNETPSPTSTLCDPVFDSTDARIEPRQMTAIKSTTARGNNIILVQRITDERVDLPLSIATVKFYQKGRVSPLQCLRRLIRRCR